MNVKDYRDYQFESSCCRTPEYVAFEKQCRKELNAQCKKYGIKLHKFKSNHFEWSAVLEKGGKFVYVSLPDVRSWNWYDDVLIRTMAHDTDWTGGCNNTCSFCDIGAFADQLYQQMVA